MASARRTKEVPDGPALAPPPEDVLLVHSPTEDGAGYRVLRKRGEEVSMGELRTAEEGKPIHGQLIQLRPREGMPLFDVDVLYEPPASEPRAGPAQVATPRYRTGWDAVFRKTSADDTN